MTARVPLPYGSWPSPISAADVARGRLHLGFPTVLGDEVWWQESRPQEGGRTTVVHYRGGRMTELLPAPWDARTRVHEYGGRSYLPVPAPGGHALIFTNFADQRMYLLAPGDRPRPLTPEPAKPGGLRYADFVLSPDGKEVWCVCEGHTPGGVRRAIVAVPLDGRAAENAGAIRELVGGADFYAFPTPSPEGGYLAWVQWNHPRMPWDGAEVRVAALQDGRTASPRTVKGGMTESALAPLWCGERSLYVISDWPGWWNIYQVGVYGESPQALYPAEEEFAAPPWRLGGAPYAMLADGRLAVLHGEGDQRLGVYDPETLELTDLDLPYTDWRPALSADGTTIVGIAGSPTRPGTVVRVDAATGRCEALRHELTHPPDAALLPRPRAGKLEGPFGRPVHALIHPPANPQAQAPDGELPPYVVFVHGGPTSRASSTLDLERAYFTSRGIGVIDVDYGGSCGHGRAYRERLRRQWGVVDVEDVIAAARALVEQGLADPRRLAVRGDGAGGWTALAAITQTDLFRAAVSYAGISDLQTLAAETHDFESTYLFGLIGPLPGFERAYAERSPLNRAGRTACPVLLLQGADDPIVPPAQSERFAAALADNGIPYAYLAFPGEAHGFRRADTMITCLEAELAFYGQTLGFEPVGVRPLKLSVGTPPAPAAPQPSPSAR
ncbi:MULTISPECIES: S9 family peptidase [Thermomonospora]|uniref:Peptidase S9 prolyl oligopeptidase active site domain protein n=1 Tax=Thermomonospora curvata (strain ATCC 19995 / DSM 43183 / JCM 3096 / KCTC 9072 / NBRC 15933 / NCIMB 10081 / Henssen B9) TaxID=471852 RepID=D1AAB6_THECD|nr:MULTISPECIES: prolyl oligopeptidase family serine peptidase [Thermomonospora]ACY98829.1 peptidase S9 prolyl oligopeptidase active site domain protein [Thermomonospora curvata DSM 43183]PKK13039.1 MAG: S9 family peptidase [Thermomonospora sp. CIF 1]